MNIVNRNFLIDMLYRFYKKKISVGYIVNFLIYNNIIFLKRNPDIIVFYFKKESFSINTSTSRGFCGDYRVRNKIEEYEFLESRLKSHYFRPYFYNYLLQYQAMNCFYEK